MIDAAHNHRREPFADESHDEHDTRDHEGVGVGDDADVDHHTDTYKEIRDEQGVADKLDGAHKRRGHRHIAVEQQAGEEGAEHGFEADELSRPCGEEDHGHDEDILRHLVAVDFEEMARQAREDIKQHEGPDDETAHETENLDDVEVALATDVDRRGEHKEGADDGDDGADDGNEHGGLFGEAETRRHGIGYQRMGGIHGAEEHRRQHVEPQDEVARQDAEKERDDERQQPEEQSAADVEPQMVHVNLESGEEHEVEQTYLAENVEARVVVEYVEAIGTDDDAGHNHADDVWNLDFIEQQRRKEDDSQNDEKNRHRLSHQRRCRCSNHGAYGFSLPWASRYSAICTALRAAPFLIWSLTVQNVRPLGLARSLRTRPTKTGSSPALSRGIG